MISDFISLTPIHQDDNESNSFILELPDIYDDDEDRMVTCGKVFLKKTDGRFWDINIALDDNFLSLSEGELYDRKSLIEAVMIHLGILTKFSFDLSDVYLKDHMGEFKYSLYE